MFCKNLRNRLKRALQHFDSYVEEHVEVALKITTTLKQLLTSPVADIVTALIPGDVDNVVRQHLLAALERAMDTLMIVEKCRQHNDVNDKLQCFAEQLQLTSPELQDALLQKLASLLASHLDGKRLKQNLYDLYTQARYAAMKQ